MKHFDRHKFSGAIYDYKHFELTEMAYPLFRNKDIPFHIISFDDIHQRVNPIAPRYLVDAESVNEISVSFLKTSSNNGRASPWGPPSSSTMRSRACWAD